MPEDNEPSFAVQTTEKLMQLQTLLQALKVIRKEVEETETLPESAKELIDGYETTIDNLFKMLISSNEHIISQDELMEDFFEKFEALYTK